MELDAWRSSPSPSPSPSLPPSRDNAKTPVLRPISVGKCHVQSAKDRFGSDGVRAIRDRERTVQGQVAQGSQTPFTWPGQNDDDYKAETSIYRKVPSMQNLRHNLTALSRVYNLYFVAYQGRIFVYAPYGGPKNTLPQEPNLQLKPPASTEAKVVGGFIDRLRPHTINHMITGFLGSEEIVLACYDDGDVVAYYTKPLARLVDQAAAQDADAEAKQPPPHAKAKRSKLRDRNAPKPFMHENVRRTAWGLAIHSRARLIAVSTNLREITVFAFAMKETSSSATSNGKMAWEPIGDVETRVRLRYRNWRIVIRLGAGADNIPNMTFLETEKGVAEKVCAVDIRGNVWVADIWKPRQPACCIRTFDPSAIRSEESYAQQSRGWGIMAFREEAFMVVNSVDDLIGMQSQRCVIKQPTPSATAKLPIAKIEESLKALPGNPCPPQQAWRLARPPRRGTTTPMLMGTLNGLGVNFQAMLNSNEVDITLQAFPVFQGTPQFPNSVVAGNPDIPTPLESESNEEDGEDDEAEAGTGAGQQLEDDSDHDSESSAAATAGSQGPAAPQGPMTLLEQVNDPSMIAIMPPIQPMVPHPQTTAQAQGQIQGQIQGQTMQMMPQPHPQPHPQPQPTLQPQVSTYGLFQPSLNPQGSNNHLNPISLTNPAWLNFHPEYTSGSGMAGGLYPQPPGQAGHAGPPGPAGQAGPAGHSTQATLAAQATLATQATITAQAAQAAQATQMIEDLLNLGDDATEEQMVAATLQSIETMQNEILLPFQNAFGTLGQALDELEQAFGQFENNVVDHDNPGPASHPFAANHKKSHPCTCVKCRRKTAAQALGARRKLEEHERLDMMYYPARGEVELAPWNRRSRQEFARKAKVVLNSNVAQRGAAEGVADGYYILRAYEKDFEMWPLSANKEESKERELSIACSDALTCVFLNRAELRPFFRGTSRMSMLLHVPELSLVVLGSPTGRVLLATLTRMALPRKDARGPWKWHHGIRAESVLPRDRDEEAHRKVQRPLHGLALAVIPDNVEEQGALPLPKRYRLMLHYQTHDIMSYEISRDSQSGRLWVI